MREARRCCRRHEHVETVAGLRQVAVLDERLDLGREAGVWSGLGRGGSLTDTPAPAWLTPGPRAASVAPSRGSDSPMRSVPASPAGDRFRSFCYELRFPGPIVYPAANCTLLPYGRCSGSRSSASRSTRSWRRAARCSAGAPPRPASRRTPGSVRSASGCPGALPVLNAAAVDLAILAALALGCGIRPASVFARKNYFYPDLPKGYQISQYDLPLAVDGFLDWHDGARPQHVRIERLHLEEDAGKSLHEGFSGHADRTGDRLQPERRAARRDRDPPRPGRRRRRRPTFFERLRAVLVEIGVTAGNMEEGHLRCDANVSLRPAGSQALGHPGRGEEPQLVPLPRARARARDRAPGGAPRRRRTRRARDAAVGRGPGADRGHAQQGGGARLPVTSREPDLPPLVVTAERIAALRSTLPELPEARRHRLATSYGLSGARAAQIGERPRDDGVLRGVASAPGSARSRPRTGSPAR